MLTALQSTKKRALIFLKSKSGHNESIEINIVDMSDWVCYSSLYGYADDTSSSICDEDLSEILRKLEIDAD